MPDRIPVDVLDRVRQHALAASDALCSADPALGDPHVQRDVDGFVDQAIDALRTIATMASRPDPGWSSAPPSWEVGARPDVRLGARPGAGRNARSDAAPWSDPRGDGGRDRW